MNLLENHEKGVIFNPVGGGFSERSQIFSHAYRFCGRRNNFSRLYGVWRSLPE